GTLFGDFVSHVGENARDFRDGARDASIGLHAHQRFGRPADPESRGLALEECGIWLRRLRDDEWIAGLGQGEAIEHGCGVANGFHLDEVLREAVAELVDLRSVRNASTRRLESHTPAEPPRKADHPPDVGPIPIRYVAATPARLAA